MDVVATLCKSGDVACTLINPNSVVCGNGLRTQLASIEFCTACMGIESEGCGNSLHKKTEAQGINLTSCTASPC